MDGERSRPGRKPTVEMTEPQRRVLREVRDIIAATGIPPTAKELADRLHLSPATAHEQVGQLVRKGYLGRIPRKARSLTVLREPDDAPVDLISIPLVGSVAAGYPIYAEENRLGDVFVDRHLVANGRHFALRITGESMRDAAIRDGDVVIVRQQPVAEHGDIVVALRNGDATVKRLSIRQHTIELRPENPDFAPIPIEPDDDFRILGKIVAVRRITECRPNAGIQQEGE